jgi:hypothetical protein
MPAKKVVSKAKEKETEVNWWQKVIKAFGVEAPVLLLVGVLIGIILSYLFLASKPELFLQPVMAYAVRETVAAQSLSNLQPETFPPTTTSNSTLQATNTPPPSDNNFFNGQKLVYDNFSEKVFLWSEGSIDTESVGYENGVYFMEIKNPLVYFTGLLWSMTNEMMEMEDFAVQADMLGPLYTDWEQKQGIVFGFQSDKKGNSFAFDISYDGMCRLVGKINDEEWKVLSTSTISNFDVNSPHNLTVIIKGSQEFSGYVDKKLCLTETIDYNAGTFGLSGKLSKNEGTLFFDNFYIYKIP